MAFNVINKNAPVLNSLALWASNDGTSFYQWGGEQSSILNISIAPVAENSLWRFDADGQGAGSWKAYSLPSGFSRASSALYASGNGSGYLLGGYISSRTDPRLESLGGWPSSPGLVSYDMATGAWTNDTSCVDGSCYRLNGYLDFVPTFGSYGVLVALGGCASNSSFFGSCKDRPPNNFSTIDVYDPSQKRWYSQTASNGPGQLPEPRGGFCGVGLQGDNGTYEIFMFGGGIYSTDATEGTSIQEYLDAVYVLSLPAFVWHKADYNPSRARTKHSCNVVGKRQMLAIGGVNPAGNIWLPADPWTQGLNVFDLTEMKWMERYDADAEDYVTPAVVKSWYDDNGMYPEWDSSEIQKIFTVNARCKSGPERRYILHSCAIKEADQHLYLVTPTTSTPTSPASTTSSQTSTTASTTAGNGSRSTNTGAVAGGVVGSFFGLALIAGLAFFLTRRRRRRPIVVDSKPPLTELHSDDAGVKELSTYKQPPHLDPPQEVDGGYGGVEAPSQHRQVSEMTG